jgi:hypothetical protein
MAENKRPDSETAKSGCYLVYIKNACIRKSAPEMARLPAPRKRSRVRRVLWRSGPIVVYQHANGCYYWVDLDRRISRPAVVGAEQS